MKKYLLALALLVSSLGAKQALAGAKVMNPGEAKGQLVFISDEDVRMGSEKFKSLSPLSIPAFAELPMDMSVVAGAITLKQQNLNSHVQLKSRARKTPNLDISDLEGGMQNELLKNFKDGDWIHLLLGTDGSVQITASSEQEALKFYQDRKTVEVKIRADLQANKIYEHAELSSKDSDKVGSKAANYAELAKALNTPERTVVRPGYALPFYYYQQFIDSNPEIKAAIEKMLRDPLMTKISKVSYREQKLQMIQAMILSEASVISQELVDNMLAILDTKLTKDGHKRKMKLRSSTNAEDLPNFNGAGLYTSESYKPEKDGVEKPHEKKVKSLKEALRVVWASVWNVRAYEERNYFRIPHEDVKMGVQINPSFSNEGVDGVVVTKNIANANGLEGAAVYIEAQRGDKYSVANPESGTRPERILVMVDAADKLNTAAYQIHVLQKSNVADDMITVLDHDNPNPIMSDENIKDLVYQSLKAEAHFKPIFGQNNNAFALDIEFKVDSEDTGSPQIYLKQARPYID